MTAHQNWLTEFAETGSDAAFRELIARYVDLVYSTALRLVGGDVHHAEDVAQTVFLNLARVARTLPKDVKLGGWLHRDTCFTASTFMRGERRRQARERQAAEMNALQNSSEADYSLVAPVLDEAINELAEEDRAAILLRFFEQNNFRTVGAALGSNEDAARMRVTRALEKLEEYLKRRGITTTAASLGVVLLANSVHAAPMGLVLTISTTAALTATTLTSTATVTATKAIAMTALQKTIVTATIAVLAGAGIYEARHASQLRDQVQTLQQQHAPLVEQVQALQMELANSTNQLASLWNDIERLNRNTGELLKLRSEIGRLKIEYAQLTRNTMDKDSVDNESVSIAKSLVNKVNTLKNFLAANPNLQFPESDLSHYFQWLKATSDTMDTEEKLIAARNVLRGLALHNFGGITLHALQEYSNANDGRFPGELSELHPYFKVPIGDEILNRYKIMEASSVESLKNSVDADGQVITQKSKMDDNEPSLFIGTRSYYLK